MWKLGGQRTSGHRFRSSVSPAASETVLRHASRATLSTGRLLFDQLDIVDPRYEEWLFRRSAFHHDQERTIDDEMTRISG